MEGVRKTFFDPLATSKARIREILGDLPIGSTHPFNPEQVLLRRTENGVEEIDISAYPEDYFFNAVDLGEMGETLLRRMAGFQPRLRMFYPLPLRPRQDSNCEKEYSKTSRSIKHQHRHSRSRYRPAKLPFWQCLNENPRTGTFASRMPNATRVAGLKGPPSRASPTAAILSTIMTF